MNNKFSNFIESNDCKVGIDENVSKKSATDIESTEKLIDKYSKYSTDELMNEFIKITEEKKRNGTLSSDFDRYNSILQPYLNDEQKSRMKDLFDKVR